MTQITKHANLRGKERCGLNKRAFERTARKAWEKGVRAADTAGALRRFLDAMAIEHRTTPVIYGMHVYCFGGDGALVTVLHLPQEHVGAVRKISHRR